MGEPAKSSAEVSEAEKAELLKAFLLQLGRNRISRVVPITPPPRQSIGPAHDDRNVMFLQEHRT